MTDRVQDELRAFVEQLVTMGILNKNPYDNNVYQFNDVKITASQYGKTYDVVFFEYDGSELITHVTDVAGGCYGDGELHDVRTDDITIYKKITVDIDYSIGIIDPY